MLFQPPAYSPPLLFKALKQALGDQLGLELIPATEPVDMLVVQRAS